MADKEQSLESRMAAASLGLKYNSDDSISSRVEQLINNKHLSDVTFIVGHEKQRIYASKMHLVTVSEYFYTMFYGNFAEAKRDEIELKDEHPETFITILRLIYGAKVDINFENIHDIFDRIRMYLLPNEYCKPLINFLMDQIVDYDTAMKIFRKNLHFKFELVDKACTTYIKNNPLYYFDQDDYTTLEEEIIRKIVSMQEINCTKEQLLSAVEKWGLANTETGTKELQQLAIRTKRSYFSHKFIFLASMEKCDSWRSETCFQIQLESRNPVALYGIGVYVIPNDKVTISLSMLDYNRCKDSVSLNLEKRCIPYLDTVDLMFKEIVLVKGEPCKFQLLMENAKGIISLAGCSKATIIHEEISLKYEMPNRKPTNTIAHVWAKFPGCDLEEKGALRCCIV
ncbi:kelch-like protein 41 [Anopheles funestus]|uniref:kelch-like protein 41 n=1 Tax=Anopheles funestus TaxID=62324 RepID=UPI0020C669E8|nr:kelch-like protein 41 [Anopheles funestus]